MFHIKNSSKQPILTTTFLAHQVQVLVVPRTGRTSTSFFYWWRSLIETETSTKSRFVRIGCFDEFLKWKTIFWLKFVIFLKNTLHWSCWKNFQVKVGTSEIFGGCCKLKTVDRRPGRGRPWTVENVILLVTSCSARKARHRHTSQYLKFQGILEFVGRKLVGSFHDLFRAIHPDKNSVPIHLLM